VLDIIVGSVKGMPVLWPFYTPRFFASPYLRQDPFELLSATGFAKELVSSECVRRFVYESMLVYLFWAGSKVWMFISKHYAVGSKQYAVGSKQSLPPADCLLPTETERTLPPASCLVPTQAKHSLPSASCRLPTNSMIPSVCLFLTGLCSVIYYGLQCVVLRLRAGIRRPYSLARVAIKDPALIQGLFFLHSCMYLFFNGKK